ncbi:MAG: hypothetical protein ACPGQQ_02930 [Candidatus Puniceispirillaceae bacterium]
MFNNDSRFDFDLKYGQGVECELLKALQGPIEVKAERDIWLTTGNIAIEYECRGHLSGIAVTEAKHWAQALMIDGQPYCYLVWPIDVLKGIARDYAKRKNIIMGGDDKCAKMVLLPLREVIVPNEKTKPHSA